MVQQQLNGPRLQPLQQQHLKLQQLKLQQQCQLQLHTQPRLHLSFRMRTLAIDIHRPVRLSELV